MWGGGGRVTAATKRLHAGRIYKGPTNVFGSATCEWGGDSIGFLGNGRVRPQVGGVWWSIDGGGWRPTDNSYCLIESS